MKILTVHKVQNEIASAIFPSGFCGLLEGLKRSFPQKGEVGVQLKILNGTPPPPFFVIPYFKGC